MKRCIVVFAKEPFKNRVKTRLQKEFSGRSCHHLYKAFLDDTLESIRGLKGVRKVLAYEAANAAPRYLRKAGSGFLLYKQVGNDLGERMHNAFSFAGWMKSRKIVIVGSDSPNLPRAYIEEAFGRLHSYDMVLGPSKDGGYYLIGLKTPCMDLFKDIRWSSKMVFERTAANALCLGKKVALLNEWYDVDDHTGLLLLRKDLQKDHKSARWTRKALKIGL